MDNTSNRIRSFSLIIVVVLIVGAIVFLSSHKTDVRGKDTEVVSVPTADQVLASTSTPITSSVKDAIASLVAGDKAKGYPVAKEITTPDGFINSSGLPISIGQYIGKKVVLVDFWTYSCINCQRTTPYLNAWYSKYEGDGFVIIGVHTPEFDFEKDLGNVQKAVVKEGIKYPVVLDNDYSTWTAYQNQYWPRKYLIDIAGYIVYDHIGEGAYPETEKKIQDLLLERNKVLGDNKQIDMGISSPQDVVTTIQTNSPETYFGSARNEYLANGTAGQLGVQSFTLPSSFDTNALYLGGTWDMQSEFAEAKGNVSIVYKFNAKEVYFVAMSDTPQDVEILLDGKSVTLKGKDIVTKNGKTFVTVKDARLYHLVDLPEAQTHTLEIRGTSGLKAFTFTFG